MKIELFDRYDLRTRICAFIFVMSPFLLDAYILVDAVRSFSSTIIISAILIASSGLFSCWIRYWGNKVEQKDYIVELLSPTSTELTQMDKKRYYEKLVKLEPSFAGVESNDSAGTQETLKAVSTWLKQKTRGDSFSLIREENLNYGFMRNVYSLKSVFLWTFSAYNAFLLGVLNTLNQGRTFKEYFASIPVEHVACGVCHVAVYLIWYAGITEAVLEFTAKKYAKAVIGAIDEL